MPEDNAKFTASLNRLRPAQLRRVQRLVEALAEGCAFDANPLSRIATQDFCEEFGDILRQHHNGSAGPFNKDKFEYGIVTVMNDCGHTAVKSPNGLPGQDVTIDGERWSLKTQADANIRPDLITISKFMELGKGDWITEDDVAALRQRMFNHMTRYERILTLRCLSRSAASTGIEYTYELVEIPKALLLASEGSKCTMKHDSRQTPKPALCQVFDQAGLAFELYFDGGTERKLQVRKLAKRNCIVHATWTFTAAL